MNFCLTFSCPDLGINLVKEAHSVKLDKILEQRNHPKGRMIIKHSYVEFLQHFVRMYEEGMLIVPGKNGIESLGKYINKHFDIRKLHDPDAEISLNTLMSKLYELKDLDR